MNAPSFHTYTHTHTCLAKATAVSTAAQLHECVTHCVCMCVCTHRRAPWDFASVCFHVSFCFWMTRLAGCRQIAKQAFSNSVTHSACIRIQPKQKQLEKKIHHRAQKDGASAVGSEVETKSCTLHMHALLSAHHQVY